MRPCLFLLAILGVAFLVADCAYVIHEPVRYHPYASDGGTPASREIVKIENNKEDNEKTGVRYYLSSPYLLVYTDGKGNLIWKVYNLPDQTKLMVATPKQFFAKATANFTFTNGVLTTSKTEADSSAAIKAMIGAIEKVLPLLFVAMVPRDTTQIIAPRLYKIIVDHDNLNLIGVQSKETVSISLKAGT